MKNYPADKIRNVCFISHGGSGKTTLAEAMLFNAKAIDRLGKVSEGNTVCDFDPQEIKRKVSVNTAIAPLEWKDTKINIIDTPGYFDFVGDLMQGLRVADSVVILVSARAGVEVGTEKSWDFVRKHHTPCIIFVNDMDDENANFYDVVNQLKEKFGKDVAPVYVPISEGGKIVGYVDIMRGRARRYVNGSVEDMPMPDGIEKELETIKVILNEAIAETSEELMEKYFAGEEFTDDEIKTAVKKGVAAGSLVPVFLGSALMNFGVSTLMNAIVDMLPSPDEVVKEEATLKSGEIVELKCTPTDPFSALVFKTVVDPYVGKMSYFKVITGEIKADSSVLNANKESTERIGHLFIVRGKKQIEVEKVTAGDIGVVTKLTVTKTGDTLCATSKPLTLKGIEFAEPNLALAILPKSKGDEEKIGIGLSKLTEEDPTFKVENDLETHQQIIKGVGEQHLDIIISKLSAKYGVSVELTEPKVPYREAIKKKVKAEGKHKKQSGGHGQFGHVWVEFEPTTEDDFVFEDKVFGGAVPKNYFPAVEKGIRDSMLHGVLAGYPVVHLKATLYDGSYHPVDSSEMSFKIAAQMAYKKGLELAGPVLLEPIGHLEVSVPGSMMGDVIGDINKRRGRILGMNPAEAGFQIVEAEVPMAEMHKYATDLRSMTQARGSFTFKFERYEEAPANVAQKIVDESKKEHKDHHE